MFQYIIMDDANNFIGSFNSQSNAIKIAREYQSSWHKQVYRIEISKVYTEQSFKDCMIYSTDGDDLPW